MDVIVYTIEILFDGSCILIKLHGEVVKGILFEIIPHKGVGQKGNENNPNPCNNEGTHRNL
jgi:hypothetical protein